MSDKVESDPHFKNEHISHAQQDSSKKIPAGQGNTVAVSVQYDPRQTASGLFLNIIENGSIPLLLYYRPKNTWRNRRAVQE